MFGWVGMAKGCAEPHPVCPPSDAVRGVDVSHWQGEVDWERVADQVGFGIARIGDGVNTADTRFGANWRGMADAGLIRGSYQFFRASQSPEDQADLVIAALVDLGDDDLAPVLDLETRDGVGGREVVDGARRWLRRVEEGTGRTPMIYTSPSFWRGLPDTGDLGGYPLWIAHWGVDCPDVPAPWTGWQVWQSSSDGRVDGIDGPVDLDWLAP